AAAMGVALVLGGAASPGDANDPEPLRKQGLDAELGRLVAEGQREAFTKLAAKADAALKSLAALPDPEVGVSSQVWADLQRALSDDPDEEKKDPSAKRKKAAQQVDAMTKAQLKEAKDGWLKMAGVLHRADVESGRRALPGGTSKSLPPADDADGDPRDRS